METDSRIIYGVGVMVIYENVLEKELISAIGKAGGRRIAVFGYQTPALITSAALRALGVETDCFLRIENYLTSGNYFGKPVKDPRDVFGRQQEYYVIDVAHLVHQMDQIIIEYGLDEDSYTRLNGLFKYSPCDIVDPLLAYGRLDDIPGFHISGDLSDEGALRIAVLGGSTTDPTYGNGRNWTDYLYEFLVGEGYRNTIFNGGIVGYMSAQERDKFMRDVLPLKPDIAIILSGDNDIGWSHCYPDKNYYSAYLVDQLVEPIYRNGRETFEDIGYGILEPRKDYENWFRNEKIIRDLADEFGIRFCCFLQPASFSGAYRWSPFEQAWQEELLRNGKNAWASIEKIGDNWRRFYDGARKLIQSEKGFYDLTHIFDETSGIYIDGIHCSEQGNRLLAEKIAGVIMKET